MATEQEVERSPSPNKRRTVPRTLSSDRLQHESTKTILSLKAEINGLTVKHREELYWLKLELDTTRKEKEAVEDRIHDLYRDMQELEDVKTKSSPVRGSTSGGKFSHISDINEMQKQLQKYEKMVRIMNNQIGLLRSSTDSLLKSLKDEISDLMDEKSRTELNLLNRLSDMEKENRELKLRLEIAEQRQQSTSLPKESLPTSPGKLNSASSRDGTLSADMKQLQEEVTILRQQNRKKDHDLASERKKSQDSLSKLSDECEELSRHVDKLQQELQVARSSDEAVSAMNRIQKDQEATKALLDRVAVVWDQADETIHNLTSLMVKLRPTDEQHNEDQERMLSVMETASLVQGQVKVSLMLIELKLRNSLACIWNDRTQLGQVGDTSDEIFVERLNLVQSEAMAAVQQVNSALCDQIANLEAQSEEVTATLTDSIESRISELQRMQSRQSELQQMLTNLRESEEAETREVVNADGSVDIFVSRKVLERLQNEVLLIVDRVKDKNEEIARLTATVDELRVRERAFMDELRRMMQEQSRIEMEERNRRMLAQAQQDLEADDDVTDSDYEDCSSSAYEGSYCAEAVEEESYLEATVEDG